MRIEQGAVNELFASGQVDIVMSGLSQTAGRIKDWNFSASPVDLTISFLVADYRRSAFSSLVAVQKMPDLRLGVVQSDPSFTRDMASHFPNAEIELMSSPRAFLRGERPDIDAVIYSAEGGSAWTLIYPDYAVAVPHPLTIKIPTGYPLPQDDPSWHRYVSQWIKLKQKNATIDSLFAHWINGAGAAVQEPRWSIIRDVLHWVD